MPAWSTTPLSVMRSLFVFLCLCSESPCQPTDCGMCWSFVGPPWRGNPTGYPSRGVVAGCAIATYLVKLFCLPVLDEVVRQHHRVSLDVFIDDSHQSAQSTPREARELVAAAVRTLTKEAQKHLRVRFAEKKTAIVLSRRKLALSVARHPGLQAESVKNPNGSPGS